VFSSELRIAGAREAMRHDRLRAPARSVASRRRSVPAVVAVRSEHVRDDRVDLGERRRPGE